MTRGLPPRESLTVEFKSDRGPLADRELLEGVVCLANTHGGELYVGVEDDGTVTGLSSKHRDPARVASLIANRTAPPITVRVRIVEVGAHRVVCVEVPRADRVTATTEGVVKRRRLQLDGRPECVPFLPHEFVTRASDLRHADYVALPVVGATMAELDPLERSRLRQMIQRFQGDAALLGLDDAALDGALGLVRREGDVARPTLLGLLLLGTESALRVHVPTHEAAFQVLAGEEVVVNDFSRRPLLWIVEWLSERFGARVEERDVQVGLFRVPVPSVDRRAFREAVANALTHRDYTRVGAVHVRWEREALSVSNPGGFVEGVTLENLLTTEPRPRNPSLADAFKRIGLVERTGRGVDLMYRGLLRYGRPAPDYSRSTGTQVVVRLSTADADLGFLEMILAAERRRGTALPVDALIALSLLREQRRVDGPRVARALQKDDASARRLLETLVEQGFIAAHGIKRGRTYTLSPQVYRGFGEPNAYVRQAGFDPIQQAEMVQNYVRAHGEIRRRDVVDLCSVSPQQATRLLLYLKNEGVLVVSGRGKGTRYRAGPRLRAGSGR